ncbi:flagellar hook-associated protein FlgK [Eubacterium oxidoreducens]|uniref:Flagellar hook-associated protein 1 n=1 Tax=Eubacterium oxidoreducens TaxID=1732 RepID=A0A1G6BRQ4_EUBOX|nr:flagellar hook-associated protein FlgK [Eubacterium oxidoreducens]SDB23309.1 flagellar hook-associated protein 1 FlgK [Eubacterium oxidoreducens]
MPSTFLGLSTAHSGLSTYQIAANTVANNISNVQTEGYSKQVTNRVASAALRVNAKYGTLGTGVETVSITQVRNVYYDNKYWTNNASVGLYDALYEYSVQIEDFFADDSSTTGFSTILSTMFNNLETLATNSDDDSVRNQFISGSQSLATYFNSVGTQLKDLQEDLNSQVKSAVDEINAIAKKISVLNDQINTIEIQGGYANELRDQRALLIDQLSEIVPTEASEQLVYNSNDPDSYTGATLYTVKINGQTLVSGNNYETLKCVARENKINQTDADGLYEIEWESTGNTFHPESASGSGRLKGLLLLRDGNNGEYFQSTITNVDTSTAQPVITVTANSAISIAELTLAQSGLVTINNVDYAYDSFTAYYNDDGELETFEFILAEGTDTSKITEGKRLTVGDDVDYMGVAYYQAQLTEFLRNFCAEFNKMEMYQTDEEGNIQTDADGNALSNYYLNEDGDPEAMGCFWVANSTVDATQIDLGEKTGSFNSLSTDSSQSYYALTALNVAVSKESLEDPNRFATTEDPLNGVADYSLVTKLTTLKDEVVMYRGCAASDFLQCLISDSSVDTEEAQIFSTNYTDMANTISNQRMSVSGVDEDEEALDLVKFQNAYNLASKMISTLSEMYDRLILETGV